MLDGDLSEGRGEAPDVGWVRGLLLPIPAGSPQALILPQSVPSQGSNWAGRMGPKPQPGTGISSPLGMGPLEDSQAMPPSPTCATPLPTWEILPAVESASCTEGSGHHPGGRSGSLQPSPAHQIWAALPAQPHTRVPHTLHPSLGLPATHTPSSWKIFSPPPTQNPPSSLPLLC